MDEESNLMKKLNNALELPDKELQHLLKLHQLVLSRLELEEEDNV
jgi:hypothetical protein